MNFEEMLVDADGHVCEPPDLWERYIDPKYKARAIRVKRGADGKDNLEIDNKPAAYTTAAGMASMGGMQKHRELGAAEVQKVNAELRRKETAISRADSSPEWEGPGKEGSALEFFGGTYLGGMAFGAMDPKERIQVLDKEGIAKAILYPTIGLVWECEVTDPDLLMAYARAYNRWIADFCRDTDGRCIPVAHIPLADPKESARELERAVKDGCKGAFVATFTQTRKPHGHPDHDVVFAACQDLDIPIAIHPTLEQPAWNVFHRYDGMQWSDWYFLLLSSAATQQAFFSMFAYGVFDRFPKLRAVVLESGSGWIGAYLDRADAMYKQTVMGASVLLKEPPSFYFKRQCFISGDPGETTIADAMKHVGEDKFMWASDYPHPDHDADYIGALRVTVDGMSTNGRRGILGENAALAYKLS